MSSTAKWLPTSTDWPSRSTRYQPPTPPQKKNLGSARITKVALGVPGGGEQLLHLLHTSDATAPATRVDTTCWQLFRPDTNTGHFFIFVVVAEVMSNYLTTDGLKKFSLLPEAP